MKEQLKKKTEATEAESFAPMTSNEQVWCTIVNNTEDTLTLGNYPPPEYGEYVDDISGLTTNPASTIPVSSTGELAFVCKGSRLMAGATGQVIYNLPNTGGKLIIMFNSPYSPDGSGGPNNSYIYALIQPDSTGSSSPTSYYAEVSGFDMALDPPTSQMVVAATITVSKA